MPEWFVQDESGTVNCCETETQYKSFNTFVKHGFILSLVGKAQPQLRKEMENWWEPQSKTLKLRLGWLGRTRYTAEVGWILVGPSKPRVPRTENSAVFPSLLGGFKHYIHNLTI